LLVVLGLELLPVLLVLPLPLEVLPLFPLFSSSLRLF
jgi:hypothetical protein